MIPIDLKSVRRSSQQPAASSQPAASQQHQETRLP